MLSGDRLSRKETSILPKTVEFMQCDTTVSFADGEEVNAFIVKIPYKEARSYNLEESIRRKMYPTQNLLEKSR